MKVRASFRIKFTAVVLCCALIVTAMVNHAQSSALSVFSFFPYMLGAILSGNVHSPSLFGYVLGLVAQWSVIGYLLSWPIAFILVGRKPHSHSPSDDHKPDAEDAAS